MGHSNRNFSKIMQQLLGGVTPASKLRVDDDSDVVSGHELSEVELLRKALSNIVEMFPTTLRQFRHLETGFRFGMTGLYRDLITGECHYGNRSYRLFIDTNSTKIPVGCTCEQSEGTKPCPHGFLFVHWFRDQLNGKNPICERVNLCKYDKTRPKLDSFKPDPTEKFRRALAEVSARLTQVKSDSADSFDSLSLPTNEVGRIAWNFYIDRSDDIQVQPVFQTPKKRGNTWTKGKKLPFNELVKMERFLSPADKRVCSKIEYSSSYYQMTVSLDPVDAALELIGQSNVLFDGEPHTVERLNMRVRLVTENESSFFEIGEEDCVNSLSINGMIAVDGDAPVLRVCQLTHEQAKCIDLLTDVPAVPKALTNELVSIARVAQQHVTVELPAQFLGETIADPGKPILLLLLDTNANLSYGCRIKLESGRVVIPGHGPSIKAETRDGKPIQLARSMRDEVNLWSNLCEKLDLPPHQTTGVISGFDEVMACMQKVRQLECDEATKLEVLWDQKSEKPIRMLGNITPSNLRVSVQKSRDWLQLSGECDFGDSKMDLGTLLRSLRGVEASAIQGNYVRLGDHGWAKISDALRKQLGKLHDSVNEDRKNLVFDASSAKVVQDLADHQIQVTGTSAWTQCLERMERSKYISPELPKNLNAQLRDYQREGYCWMSRLAEWGVGGVLADDMGLGKTLQTLAVLLDRSTLGPALVIAPTSVGFNWVREAEKFTPDLKAHLYRETDRDDFLSNVGPGDLVVCSYGLVLRDSEKLSKIEWGTLVLDEAQAVKNARSKTATAIADLKADWKVALTGTPVENHLGELWSLFRSISPGVFGGWEQFRKRFAAPIEKDNDEDRRMALRERIQPFVLRRTKQEVLKDLPPRTETNLYIDLTPEEREVYNRVRLSAVGELDEIAKLSDIQDQRFKMLALLTRLRQLSCSPKLVHSDWPGRSSKLQQLAETLLELREEGHRVLVFSQFVTHLELIRQMLTEEGISFQYLDGSTTPKDRQKRVDEFQNGNGDVFLISLKAGGTGLNLTAADYVIHTDPWWNPAVEDQATDRAHRIGQDKPVMVYRLIAKGTIEEEILKLHDSKRDLVAGILEGSQAAGKLSTADLMELIRK